MHFKYMLKKQIKFNKIYAKDIKYKKIMIVFIKYRLCYALFLQFYIFIFLTGFFPKIYFIQLDKPTQKIRVLL